MFTGSSIQDPVFHPHTRQLIEHGQFTVLGYHQPKFSFFKQHLSILICFIKPKWFAKCTENYQTLFSRHHVYVYECYSYQEKTYPSHNIISKIPGQVRGHETGEAGQGHTSIIHVLTTQVLGETIQWDLHVTLNTMHCYTQLDKKGKTSSLKMKCNILFYEIIYINNTIQYVKNWSIIIF